MRPQSIARQHSGERETSMSAGRWASGGPEKPLAGHPGRGGGPDRPSRRSPGLCPLPRRAGGTASQGAKARPALAPGCGRPSAPGFFAPARQRCLGAVPIAQTLTGAPRSASTFCWNHAYVSASPRRRSMLGCQPSAKRRETSSSLRGVPSGLLLSNTIVPS